VYVQDYLYAINPTNGALYWGVPISSAYIAPSRLW
jgi:hypothetical protein